MDNTVRGSNDETGNDRQPILIDLSVERPIPQTGTYQSPADSNLPRFTIVGMGGETVRPVQFGPAQDIKVQDGWLSLRDKTRDSTPARTSFDLGYLKAEPPFKIASPGLGIDGIQDQYLSFPGLSSRRKGDFLGPSVHPFQLTVDRLKPDFAEYLDLSQKLLSERQKTWAEGLLADDPSISQAYEQLPMSIQLKLRTRAAEDLVFTERTEMEATYHKQQQSFINSGPIIPDPRPVSEKPVSATELTKSWNLDEDKTAKLDARVAKLDAPDRTLRAIDRIHSLLSMLPDDLVKEFEERKILPAGTSAAQGKSDSATRSKEDLASWLAGDPSPNADYYAAIFTDKNGSIQKDLDALSEQLVEKLADKVDDIAAQSIDTKKKIDEQLEIIRLAQESLVKDSAQAVPSTLTWMKYFAEQSGSYPTTQQPIQVPVHRGPTWHPNDKAEAVQSAYVEAESERQRTLLSTMQTYAKLQEQQEKLDLARDMAEYTSFRDGSQNDRASEMLLNIWSEHGIRFAYKKDNHLVLSVDEALTQRKNWMPISPMLELGTPQSLDQGVSLLQKLPEYKCKGSAVIEPLRNRALMSINSAPEIMAAVNMASKVQPILSELSTIVRAGNESGNFSEDLLKQARAQADSLKKLLDDPGVSPQDLKRAIDKMEALVDGDHRNGEIDDLAANKVIHDKVESLKKVLAFLSPETAEGRQIRQVLNYVRGAGYGTESVSKWLLEHGPEMIAGLIAFAAVAVTLASCGAATPLAVAALGTAGSMAARETVRLTTHTINERFGYTGVGRRLDNPPLAEFARQFPNRSTGERLESFYTDIVMPYAQEWALNTAILYGTMSMANALAGVEAVGQHEASFLAMSKDLAVMGAFEVGGRGTELLARDFNRYAFDGKAPQATAMFFHLTGGFAMAYGMAKACRMQTEFDQNSKTLVFKPTSQEGTAAFIQACKEQNLPIEQVGDHFELKVSELPDHARQSMQFTDLQQLNRPMADGFVDGGKYQTFDAEGHIVSKPQRYIVKLDANTDLLLFELTKMAKKHLSELPERERAAALTTMVNELFSGGELSTKSLLDRVMERRAALAGQEIPMGELVATGEGVCIERALLMKYIGDRVGLKVNLVRGASGEMGANSLDHAWTEVTFSDGQTLIYDPAAKVYGAPHSGNLKYLYRRGADVIMQRVLQKEAGARR